MSPKSYSLPKVASQREYLINHLFSDTKYSDITINAFGRSYNLHKFFLCRSPYFEALFNWTPSSDYEFSESGESEEISIGTDDPYITKDSFESLLRRLYGVEELEQEYKIPCEMIATGNYFALPELIETAASYSIQHMTINVAAYYAKFISERVTDSVSLSISKAVKFCLLADGWQAGAKFWDGIPADIIVDTVGDDRLYVPSEYYRALFVINLIDRRLKKPGGAGEQEIERLKSFLRDDILYPTISLEGLMDLMSFEDNFGERYVPLSVLFNAISTAKTLSSDTGKVYRFSTSSTTSKTNPLENFNRPGINTGVSSIPPLRISLKLAGLDSIGDGQSRFTKGFRYGGSTWILSCTQFISSQPKFMQIYRTCLDYNPLSGAEDNRNVNSLFDSPNYRQVDRPRMDSRRLFYNSDFKSALNFDNSGISDSFYVRLYVPQRKGGGCFIEKSLMPKDIPDCNSSANCRGKRRHNKEPSETQNPHSCANFPLQSFALDEILPDSDCDELTLMVIIGFV